MAKRLQRLGALTAAIALAACAGCRAPRAGPLFAGMVRQVQWVMGTRLSIAVPDLGGEKSEGLLRECFAIARGMDDLLSDYKATSALSRLSSEATGAAVRVDPRLFAFLRRALADAARTDGTFDVTVGAITHLHRAGKATPESIRAALGRIGARLVEIGDGTVRVAPGVKLDPGGIGKGWALDAIVAHLRNRGVRRAYLDFGGSSFYGLGAPRGRRGWPVLLGGLDPARPLGVAWLKDQSLSSSMATPPPDPDRPPAPGHIVDPRTGRLVVGSRFAAAVSASATDADVLSTALIVDPGLREVLARRYPGSLLLVAHPGRPIQADPGWRAILEPPEAYGPRE
jgi:thiamine biosynthesis lipoprotein